MTIISQDNFHHDDNLSGQCVAAPLLIQGWQLAEELKPRFVHQKWLLMSKYNFTLPPLIVAATGMNIRGGRIVSAGKLASAHCFYTVCRRSFEYLFVVFCWVCWFQLHCLCSSCCDTVALGAASRPAVSNGHKKSSCMGYQNRRKLVNTDEQLFSFSKVALSFKYHRTSSSKSSVPQKYGRLMFASSC